MTQQQIKQAIISWVAQLSEDNTPEEEQNITAIVGNLLARLNNSL